MVSADRRTKKAKAEVALPALGALLRVAAALAIGGAAALVAQKDEDRVGLARPNYIVFKAGSQLGPGNRL